MMKLLSLLASLCAVSSADAFGLTSKGLQTRFDAGLVRSTTLKSVPFDSVENVATKFSEASHAPKRKRQDQSKRNAFQSLAKSALSFAFVVSTIAAVSPAAHAAKAAEEVVEHLHVGQKIANYFRSFGVPDLAVLAIISAMPVVELRGAVPVGVWMGLPITQILPVCVLGNMAPIVPLMFMLRNDKLKSLMSPILSRAEKKSASLGVGSIEKQWASLAAFVGIPLPGTGAWTGAMGAFLLGMPTAVALSSIFTGVVGAGCIMSSITLAGKKGGIAALAALALITGREFFVSKDEEE
mmetsp:Transcript_52732/g.112040  ORF Transcript_52732/g.112040 Transcript_52732/m.112040 type:complete len:296 (-) Transcript_52732:195-1082(-)|eukprot:CAMPEP_0172551612 /NCGR_PEP_ID=MMETSP1067-20121228/40101_1 /TAXON_ID=265564 ORGANISM="Thalassiosira punctigera, Strain Tpunct2005C2" /NCGR_SAMPLE_ID=MMETSP1067 /ASSEMBLY_ACC=CAM_ASM_000444 /LENGTH=295 /DNA_ID=CAMNT_0013339421 /DNA_START=47 /DNA_END=934 /DNA_ORIENTATION=-